jgi:hypothetical protein
MADLLIERCLPSARATEIQGLFIRAGQPEFRTVYDRVYRVRERSGLRSWIGMLEGQAVLHISVAPQPFSDGTRTFTGGLLADLMADDTRRDFWGPVKLARQMVGDLRRDGAIDFLLTSYLPMAEAVFKAAGFRQFGVLRRHVLPLVWPYPLLRRVLHGEPRPRLTAVPFGSETMEALSELRSPGCFRAMQTPEYFATRMPRIEYPSGTWLISGALSAPDAAVLVSPGTRGGLMVVDLLWRDATVGLAGLLSAVAGWASRAGHRRLNVSTLEGSRLAIAARRAGFLLRPDSYPIMLATLKPSVTLPPPHEWMLTPFLLTAW